MATEKRSAKASGRTARGSGFVSVVIASCVSANARFDRFEVAAGGIDVASMAASSLGRPVPALAMSATRSAIARSRTCAKGASAEASSPTPPNRLRGSFSRQRRMSHSSASGRSGRRARGEGAASWLALRPISSAVGASNGSLHVSSSYRTTPMDQMSVRSSTSLEERICSGDMYAGEPNTVLVVVSDDSLEPAGSVNLEMPKSSTLTWSRPSWPRVRKRFAGFRSRWMIPAA